MKWLATWIMKSLALADSTDWSAAMQREFDELKSGHFAWAAGCLVALSRACIRREAKFAAAIILLPLASMIFGVAITLVSYWLFFQNSGWPHIVMSLPMILLQLPFAVLLGTIKPWRVPLLVGAAGFFTHQFFPQFLFWIIFDAPFHFWWGPNVTIYNMTPPMGYSCSVAMWVTGAYLGSALAKKRLAHK